MKLQYVARPANLILLQQQASRVNEVGARNNPFKRLACVYIYKKLSSMDPGKLIMGRLLGTDPQNQQQRKNDVLHRAQHVAHPVNRVCWSNRAPAFSRLESIPASLMVNSRRARLYRASSSWWKINETAALLHHPAKVAPLTRPSHPFPPQSLWSTGPAGLVFGTR